LLPTWMKIATYNNHVKAPSFPASSSSNKEYCVGRGLRSYPIKPFAFFAKAGAFQPP
jgi:hypothetical protein